MARVPGRSLIRGRIVAALVAVGLAGCADARETQLVVRTTLPQELRDFVEESFEAEHPDVDVRFTEGEPTRSFHDLQVAEDGVPFDVWWGAPATTLHSAGSIGLLEPFRPTWVDQAGVGEPSQDSHWQVTLVTPFVLAFNREDLTLTRAPRDWIDTFHHRWADEVWVLDPTRNDAGATLMGSMLVEALRDDDDLRRGFDWLGRLDTQVKRYVGDAEEAIRALEQRDGFLAVLPRAAVEEARGDGDTWLYYRLPESGTPLLALGVAITEGSMARNAAARFVEHLGRLDVATETKLHTHWQPAHGDVDRSMLPDGFEIDQNWTAFPLATDTLMAELEGWITRWDLDVRDAGK